MILLKIFFVFFKKSFLLKALYFFCKTNFLFGFIVLTVSFINFFKFNSEPFFFGFIKLLNHMNYDYEI